MEITVSVLSNSFAFLLRENICCLATPFLEIGCLVRKHCTSLGCIEQFFFSKIAVVVICMWLHNEGSTWVLCKSGRVQLWHRSSITIAKFGTISQSLKEIS